MGHETTAELRQLLGEMGCGICGPNSDRLSAAVDDAGSLLTWCRDHGDSPPAERLEAATRLVCPACGPDAGVRMFRYLAPLGPVVEARCKACEGKLADLLMPSFVVRRPACCPACDRLELTPSRSICVANGSDGILTLWCDEHQQRPSVTAGPKGCEFCGGVRFLIVTARDLRTGHEQIEAWCPACGKIGHLFSQRPPEVNAVGGEC